jgi:hypothetical protein
MWTSSIRRVIASLAPAVKGRLVLLEHRRERRHADDFDFAFQLAVGKQEQPQIGPGRHGQPAPLDEAEVFFQPCPAGLCILAGGALQVDGEFLVAVAEGQAETLATLLDPRDVSPRLIVRGGTSDTAPTRGPCCFQFAPKAGIRGEGDRRQGPPILLEFKGLLRELDGKNSAEREGFSDALPATSARLRKPL